MTPSMLPRLALAVMVALLLGAVPLAQTAEPAQDDSFDFEALLTRANAGDAEAQDNLCEGYQMGEDVPQDYVEAAAWCRKAADQGILNSQWLLGMLYSSTASKVPRTGTAGLPVDDIEAYKWYYLAAVPRPGETFGESMARELIQGSSRDLVAERLTPEQLAEGGRRVGMWIEKFSRQLESQPIDAHPREP